MKKDQVFEQALEELNPEQRQAVEKIQGPVMVIAGPGTGKTQILAMRIGNILRKTDASPSNILCLTYTEAGTVAMRNRLNELIGPEAYNINIHTFHGFCNRIIQEYPARFSSNVDLKPLDDLERIGLFIKMIDNWGLDHPMKRLKGDIYYDIPRLKDLFTNMKREGWSSAHMIEKIDAYIEEMPFMEEFQFKVNRKPHKKGDPRQKKIDEVTEKMEILKAASLAFDEYNSLMTGEGRYDYDDMILWVLDEIRRNEDLLFDLQEKYQYLLVDEYQDTNGAQNQILFELCGEPNSEPNVFVVGDDDQSIYRFQGANLDNILKFADRFRDSLSTVVLKSNYRSSDSILNASADLIAHNKERLSNQIDNIDKKLHAAGSLNSAYNSGVLVGAFNSETEELLAVQNYIQDLLDHGVDPQQIAVLFRKRKHVVPLINYFLHRGIPYDVKKIDNVLKDPLVDRFIQILRYVHDELVNPFISSHDLFKILHFPWFGIPAIDVAKLAVELRDKKRKNWRSWLSHPEERSHLKLIKEENLEVTIGLLEQWIKTGTNGTPQQLLQEIIYSKPVFQSIMQGGDSFIKLQTINSFFNFLKDQMDKQQDLSLGHFLQLIDQMHQHDISLTLTKIEKTGDGIQLMTAHGSKGLEFEHVIIIGANSNKWEDARGYNRTFTLPPNLTLSQVENKVEDERRLFYVSLTRAKKEALISYSENQLNGKPATQSRYVTEIKDGGHYSEYKYDVSAQLRKDFLVSQFIPSPEISYTFPPQIDSIIEETILNPSGINKYLNCPVAYYYENVLRVPQGRTAPMGFGNAVHKCLERSFQLASGKEDYFPSFEEVLLEFEKAMKNYHSHFTPQEFAYHLEHGQQKLRPYYEYHVSEWKKIPKSEMEKKVNNIEIDGIPVSGVFDRVDFLSDHIKIVDYKTGSVTNGISKLKPPENNADELKVKLKEQNDPEERKKLRKKINGGDYWRQLVLYKLMSEASSEISRPFGSVSISFIESDSKPDKYNQKLVIKPEYEAIVKNQIQHCYTQIRSKIFGPGCGRDDCEWCTIQNTILQSDQNKK